MSFTWILANVFSLDYAGLMSFREKRTKVKCHSHHVVARVRADNMIHHC